LSSLISSTIFFSVPHNAHKNLQHFTSEFMKMYNVKCTVYYRINV
jgi:hypothetical protein